MDTIANFLQLLCAASIGIYAGAMLTEAGVLVPMWRSLPGQEFVAWYAANAARLNHFFGRATMVAGFFAIAAALATWVAGDPARYWSSLAASLVFMCVAMFPLYFRGANESFRTGALAADRLEQELARWSRLHRLRVMVSMAAFVAALTAAS